MGFEVGAMVGRWLIRLLVVGLGLAVRQGFDRESNKFVQGLRQTRGWPGGATPTG